LPDEIWIAGENNRTAESAHRTEKGAMQAAEYFGVPYARYVRADALEAAKHTIMDALAWLPKEQAREVMALDSYKLVKDS
jgi:hypothetical protein